MLKHNKNILSLKLHSACSKLVYPLSLESTLPTFLDSQSYQFYTEYSYYAYLKYIYQNHHNQTSSRSLRYALPEICVYSRGSPNCLIRKPTEKAPISLFLNASRLNLFEVQKLFSEAYAFHNVKEARKLRLRTYSERENYCIVLAKYKDNINSLFTLKQIEGLFKSKNFHLKDGLMYMRTLVGGEAHKYTRIKIDIDYAKHNNPTLFYRAKTYTMIFLGYIKPPHKEYHSETNEISFYTTLRTNIRYYLLYLSLKILLIDSRCHTDIVSRAMFKYIVTDKRIYLWDIRVGQYKKSELYWESLEVKAFEDKIKKTMVMMETETIRTLQYRSYYNPRPKPTTNRRLNSKLVYITKWLYESTVYYWQYLQLIRNRLNKRELQKKELLSPVLQKSFQLKLKSYNRSLRNRTSNQNPEAETLGS